jgi:hypothetical protein
LKRLFKSVEFLKLESAGEILSVVKGHDSTSAVKMEKNGEGSSSTSPCLP